jgi:hypothetical protein
MSLEDQNSLNGISKTFGFSDILYQTGSFNRNVFTPEGPYDSLSPNTISFTGFKDVPLPSGEMASQPMSIYLDRAGAEDFRQRAQEGFPGLRGDDLAFHQALAATITQTCDWMRVLNVQPLAPSLPAASLPAASLPVEDAPVNTPMRNASISLREGIKTRESSISPDQWADMKINMACAALSRIQDVPPSAEGDAKIGSALLCVKDAVNDRLYGKGAVNGPPSPARLDAMEKQVTGAMEDGLKGAGDQYKAAFADTMKSIATEIRNVFAKFGVNKSKDMDVG